MLSLPNAVPERVTLLLAGGAKKYCRYPRKELFGRPPTKNICLQPVCVSVEHTVSGPRGKIPVFVILPSAPAIMLPPSLFAYLPGGLPPPQNVLQWVRYPSLLLDRATPQESGAFFLPPVCVISSKSTSEMGLQRTLLLGGGWLYTPEKFFFLRPEKFSRTRKRPFFFVTPHISPAQKVFKLFLVNHNMSDSRVRMFRTFFANQI